MSKTEQKVQTAAQLFDQVRTYLRMERKYITIDVSERISKVLSWFVLALIVIGAVMLTITLLLLTLIHLLGTLLGNITLAYAIATVISLLLVWVIWRCREALFMRPIARAINNALREDEPTHALTADPREPSLDLPDSKSELHLMIRLKEKEIKESYDQLFEPANEDPSVGERVGNIIDRGLSVYRGASIALGLFNLFKGKKDDASKVK